jgi:hypothetical protein
MAAHRFRPMRRAAGCRKLHRRSRTRRKKCRPQPSTGMGSHGFATNSRWRRRVPRGSGSTESSCISRTVTCSTNSCRPCRTGAPTSTAAAGRTACAFRWKCSTQCARRRPACRCGCASRRRTGSKAAGTCPTRSRSCRNSGAAAALRRTCPVAAFPRSRRSRSARATRCPWRGLITEPEQADGIIARGDADAVAMARAMLYDPRWPWHAAAKLGAQVDAPKPYWRSQPREHKDLFRGLHFGQR